MYEPTTGGQKLFYYGTNALMLIQSGVSLVNDFRAGLFTVPEGKWNYFFGRVTTGNIHNVRRSAQNLKDLTEMGITKNSQLMQVFKQAFNSGKFISKKTTQYGVSIKKRVPVGSNGSIDVSFFYAGGNMKATPIVSSIIPKTW